MSDERTFAPSPLRWRRAWAAGLRPRARWLWPAVAFGGLTILLDELGAGRSGTIPAELDLRPGQVAPQAWLETAVGWLAAGFCTAGLVVVAVAVLSRRLGLVSTLEQRRLGAAPDRPGALVRLGLVAVVLVGLALALVGVVAGAARSVDASEAGLVALWLGWAQRGSAALALGLGAGAAVELWLDHRERGLRLRQSPQQLRAQRREGGAR